MQKTNHDWELVFFYFKYESNDCNLKRYRCKNKFEYIKDDLKVIN